MHGPKETDTYPPQTTLPAATTSQVTQHNIIRVLIGGFALVFLLLLAAGFMGVRNVKAINENSEALVREQIVTTRLISEVQRERNAINAVFYNLGKEPDLVDRQNVIAQLDEADQALTRLSRTTADAPDYAEWQALSKAAAAFSAEARRLLAQEDPESLSSFDLLNYHQEVLGLVSKLSASGYQKAVKAQNLIQQRSQELTHQSLGLLGACLVLALLCAILTVRLSADLFRRMEWQTGELSRVSWHMLQNQETVAKRFSHELHDELGQSLTAIKANLVALAASGDYGHRLNDCRSLVDEAIRNVREMSQLLHPTILDDFGLDAAIRSLCEGFEERTGIQVDYISAFQDRLNDDQETHVFRIAQEALTNVARHSGATKVRVELKADHGRVWLTIQDNGRGLSGADPAGSGIGMIGMRARARSMGGEVTVQSPHESGVRIELWAPLEGSMTRTNDPHPVS